MAAEALASASLVFALSQTVRGACGKCESVHAHTRSHREKRGLPERSQPRVKSVRSVPEQPMEGEDTSVSSCMCMDYATCVYVYVCLPTYPSLSVCSSICIICLWISQYLSVPRYLLVSPQQAVHPGRGLVPSVDSGQGSVGQKVRLLCSFLPNSRS